MRLLSRLFGSRWSLYIVRNGNELVYAMHENSVVRIAGYVMGYFANGARPVTPWSLHLNFNKSHQSFDLGPEHFSADGENVSKLLLETIQAIDQKWQQPGSEPVFIEASSKKQLKISQRIDDRDLQGAIDRLKQPREPTFYSVMDTVFGRSRA